MGKSFPVTRPSWPSLPTDAASRPWHGGGLVAPDVPAAIGRRDWCRQVAGVALMVAVPLGISAAATLEQRDGWLLWSTDR